MGKHHKPKNHCKSATSVVPTSANHDVLGVLQKFHSLFQTTCCSSSGCTTEDSSLESSKLNLLKQEGKRRAIEARIGLSRHIAETHDYVADRATEARIGLSR